MRYLIGLLLVGLVAFYIGGYAPDSLFPDITEMATTTEETADAEDETEAKPSTTQTAPKPAAQSGDAGKRIFQNGVYVTIVEYSEAGFNPSKLDIARGEEVRFVNKDNETMMVVGDAKLSSRAYAQLKMPTSVGKGGTWQLSFIEPGIFSYTNVNKPYKPSGQIFVK